MPSPTTSPDPDFNVTFAAIARRAGVDVSTVSRVLNHRPGHAQATRDRVLAAARALNYRPNPLVSAWMEKVRGSRRPTNSGTLALLSVTKDAAEWRHERHPIYSYFYRGMVEQAEARGFRIEEFAAGAFGADGRRLSQVLRSRGINGVIVAPLPLVTKRLPAYLDWEHFAVAAIGFSLESPVVHRACHDAFHGAQLAWQQLTRQGCQRIGFYMSAFSSERMNRLWLGGYLASQQDVPASRRIPPLIYDEPEEITAWLKRHPLDGLISLGPRPLQALHAAGYRIPEELCYAALDWCAEIGDIAGIDQRPEKIGALAADLAINGINRNERGVPAQPQTVLLKGVWHPGSTVRERSS